MNDIRYAFRFLKKSPGFVLLAILMLAIGTGLTTALFTVIQGVLLRPLAFQDPDQLMILSQTSSNERNISVSYQDYLDWRKQSRTFENMTALRLDEFNLMTQQGAERVRGRMISASFFSTLGIQPEIGRDFREDEDRVGGTPAVILNHKLWKDRFQSDHKVLGQTIRASDKSFTIVGVMKQDYHLFTEVDLFFPIGQFAENWPKRDNHPGIYVIGRLQANATMNSAQAEMNQIALALSKQYPDTNSRIGAVVEDLSEQVTGDVRPALWMLFGAVIFVLLIGCANIANMLLARGLSRQKEISIRMALGASNWNLMRQFLMESLLLSFTGGILGLLFAQYATDMLLWLRPADLPRLDEIKIDFAVLAFMICISAISGIFFGLLPAMQSSRIQLNESIKDSSAASYPFRSRHRLRHALVISQVAFSLVLLIGAGLMTKSIFLILKSSPGFEPNGVLTADLSLSTERYQGAKVLHFIQEAQQRLEGIAGVESVAYSNGLPIAGANEGIFWIDHRPRPRPGEEPASVCYYVSPNYLQTMKIPLVRGSYLSTLDGTKQPSKVIIDEALAKKYFASEDPIGKSIRLAEELPPFEIIGIAGHVKHYGLDVTPPIQEESYFSIPQIPEEFLSQVGQDLHFLIRSSGDSATVAASAREVFKKLDPQQPVALRAMDEVLAESLAARKFSMILLSIFAGVAFFLAVGGIYGVLSYTVAQRAKEIGIRMAVGAAKMDVLRLILGGGLRLIVAGLALGILAALGLSNLVASQFYGVTATDPMTFTLISVLFAVVGSIATYFPASRASRVDPNSILKYE